MVLLVTSLNYHSGTTLTVESWKHIAVQNLRLGGHVVVEEEEEKAAAELVNDDDYQCQLKAPYLPLPYPRQRKQRESKRRIQKSALRSCLDLAFFAIHTRSHAPFFQLDKSWWRCPHHYTTTPSFSFFPRAVHPRTAPPDLDPTADATTRHAPSSYHRFMMMTVHHRWTSWSVHS